MDDQSFEDILAHLALLTESEYNEAVVAYFTHEIARMDDEALSSFRELCERRSEGTAVENRMVEIMHGQIILRELGFLRRND